MNHIFQIVLLIYPKSIAIEYIHLLSSYKLILFHKANKKLLVKEIGFVFLRKVKIRGWIKGRYLILYFF